MASVANGDYELGFELYEILPDAILKMLLGADVALEFAPAGVVWRLACPADRVRESEEPRQPEFAAHPVNARG